jgi:hypothetical protein
VGEVEEDEAAHVPQVLHALDRVIRQAQGRIIPCLIRMCPPSPRSRIWRLWEEPPTEV